jgi:hypothetical protein
MISTFFTKCSLIYPQNPDPDPDNNFLTKVLSGPQPSCHSTCTGTGITFEVESVPDEEGDLLDGDLLVGGEDDWLHLLVLAQHPDEQPGQVCNELKGIK